MSGVIIGVKDDKIISRLAALSTPKPDSYPRTRLGVIFYFIPGASISRFPIGASFKESKQ
jgi:hypothetical protein